MCNCNSKTKENYNEKDCSYNSCNSCDPCNTDPCGCSFKVDTQCIIHSSGDFCAIQVPNGGSLDEILTWVDNFICDLSNFTVLNKSIGAGIPIYAGVDPDDSFHSFKTISGSESVDIDNATDPDELIFSIDEDWLTVFIDNVIQNSTITLVNIGNEIEIYKGFSLGLHEFRTLVSDSILITQESDVIRFELISFDDIPRFIVNNLYTGMEELGTLSKPFKTIQGALDAFQGSGSIDAPENPFSTIIIQEGNTYNFSGNFTYRNLNLVIEENVIINHISTTGSYFVNYDVLSDLKSTLMLEIRSGAVILLNQKGFRNRGSLGGAAQAKSIEIIGEGEIRLQGSLQSGYSLIEANYQNLAGYAMPFNQNFVVTGVSLTSIEKDVWNIGRDAAVIFRDANIRHSFVTSTINPASESFSQLGGSVTVANCNLFINGGSRVNGFTLFKFPTYNCILTITDSYLQFPSTIENLFVNLGGLTQAKLVCDRLTTNSGGVLEVFKSTVLWTDVLFRYNTFFSGNIDNTQVDLTQNNTISTTNIIDGNNIDSLIKFTSRAAAVTAGMPLGATFINTNFSDVDTATHFLDIVI